MNQECAPISRSNRNILIVDDDREMGALIKKVLSRENYTVHVAHSGTEGILLLQRETFDLIISDLRMPGISGIELIRASKKIAPETPLILITAFGDIQTYLDALGAGAFDYINKPLKMRDLRHSIRKALVSTDADA
jgi:DNA-binding NtrC family response regulator